MKNIMTSFLIFIMSIALSSHASAYDLIVSEKICNQLVVHMPNEDVTYTSIVDEGSANVDLNPSPLNEIGKSNQTQPVDIEIDLNEFSRIGIFSTTKFDIDIEPKIDLPLTYQKGRLYYKDQPISQDHQINITHKCLEMREDD